MAALKPAVCNRKALKYSLPSCDRWYTEFAKTLTSYTNHNLRISALAKSCDMELEAKSGNKVPLLKKCLHKGADKLMCLCIFWQQSIFNSVWLRRVHQKINHTIYIFFFLKAQSLAIYYFKLILYLR